VSISLLWFVVGSGAPGIGSHHAGARTWEDRRVDRRAGQARVAAVASMGATRWMALSFALGSACFLIGPFPGYADLVGGSAVAVTFFVGAILFTIGGTLQSVLAWPDRARSAGGRAAWWTAIVQSAGTLCFNATTAYALHVTTSSPQYDRLVWRPDAAGSVFFLVSGAIAYVGSRRRGLLPAVTGPGWWEPAVNLLGCVLFGISAVAGYLVPSRGSILDLAAANWTTAAGAGCFLACAVASLFSGETSKLLHGRRISAWEHEAVAELDEAVTAVERLR
jgi:hypothetical protein